MNYENNNMDESGNQHEESNYISKADSKANSMTIPVCQVCNVEYSEDNVFKVLPCYCLEAPICSKCLEEILNSNDKKYTCKRCEREFDFTGEAIDNFPNLDSIPDDHSNNSSQMSNKSDSINNDIEFCDKHNDKTIEYFCEECVKVVCVDCIYFSHNGHKLSTLFEKTNVIKHNIKDFNKVLRNLAAANSENNDVVMMRFQEIETLKSTQFKIVNTVFEDLAKTLVDKKKEFDKEFEHKYSLEEKRFKKLSGLMNSTNEEIIKMIQINEQLVSFSEIRNEGKILKKIDDFTMFLQKSYLDLKRLYKAEMSLKAEMKLDPGMNPININTKNLMMIIEKIDPKVICYYNDNYENNNQGNNYMFGYNNNLKNNLNNNAPNKFNLYPNKKPFNNLNNMNPGLSKSNLDESSVNLTTNNPHNKIQYDYIAEDLKNFKNNLALMEMSAIKTEDSESDIFNKRKNKLNIPKPEKHSRLNPMNKLAQQGNFNNNEIASNQQTFYNNDKNKGNNFRQGSQVMQGLNSQLNKEFNQLSRNHSKNSSVKSGQSFNKINSQNQSRYSLPKLNSVEMKVSNINSNKANSMNKKLFNNAPQVGGANIFNHDYKDSKNYFNDSMDKNNYNDIQFNAHDKHSNDKQNFTPMFIAISDSSFVLKYNLDNSTWRIERLDNISTFDGGIKYSSCVCIKPNRLLITGGCYMSNNEPTNNVFELNSVSINHSIKLKPMTRKRWAHMTCFSFPFVYIIGGFEHKDVTKSAPITLKYCEKYNIETDRYEGLAHLNQARAFSGISIINNQNIFVFGGFYNDTLIPSIEKYDILANVWVTFHVKLIDSLAKMGVINYKNNIILLGGINEQYQMSNRAVVLDLQLGKWKKLPEMLDARVFSNSAFIHDSAIYTIGGNADAKCERFDLISNKWNSIESYSSLFRNKITNIPNIEMYSFCFSTNWLSKS